LPREFNRLVWHGAYAVHLSLFIIDSQLRFDPPQWLIDGIGRIIGCMMNVVSDERHDKSMTLFEKLLGHPFFRTITA
jgi:hypothetical protein